MVCVGAVVVLNADAGPLLFYFAALNALVNLSASQLRCAFDACGFDKGVSWKEPPGMVRWLHRISSVLGTGLLLYGLAMGWI
jgi:hypothetical protein